MKKWLWVIITFFFCLQIFVVGCNSPQKEEDRLSNHSNSLDENIGNTFNIGTLRDTSGKTARLELSHYDYTIIDFWFNDCPPCIEEMTQFADLLSSKAKNIQIISISINRFSLWKSILTAPAGRFLFLSESRPNWLHLNLHSLQDERLKNDLPSDNFAQLIERFNVNFFPAYFVLDKNGVILSRPISAVEYLTSL